MLGFSWSCGVEAHQALTERVLVKAWAELDDLQQLMVFSGHLRLFGDGTT